MFAWHPLLNPSEQKIVTAQLELVYSLILTQLYELERNYVPVRRKILCLPHRFPRLDVLEN
jgi:hypothetical protein